MKLIVLLGLCCFVFVIHAATVPLGYDELNTQVALRREKRAPFLLTALAGAGLVGAGLVGAGLAGAGIVGAKVIGAKIIGAKVIGAGLVGAGLGAKAGLAAGALAGSALHGSGTGSYRYGQAAGGGYHAQAEFNYRT